MSDDSRVGYKRPPVQTRFKAGTSGNLSGRPKRRPTFRSVLMDELAGPVPTQGIAAGHSVTGSGKLTHRAP